MSQPVQVRREKAQFFFYSSFAYHAVYCRRLNQFQAIDAPPCIKPINHNNVLQIKISHYKWYSRCTDHHTVHQWVSTTAAAVTNNAKLKLINRILPMTMMVENPVQYVLYTSHSFRYMYSGMRKWNMNDRIVVPG